MEHVPHQFRRTQGPLASADGRHTHFATLAKDGSGTPPKRTVVRDVITIDTTNIGGAVAFIQIASAGLMDPVVQKSPRFEAPTPSKEAELEIEAFDLEGLFWALGSSPVRCSS